MSPRSWTGPVILLREPWRATLRRLAWRAALLAVGVALAGVPGVWGGLIDAPVVRAVGWVLVAAGALFVGLSIANLARSRRALLVLRPSGEIERPASVQEGWLRRPREWVAGETVEVTEAVTSVVPSRADPRVTLASQGSAIVDVPLWGVAPETLVERCNAVLEGRGVTLRHVPPAIPED